MFLMQMRAIVLSFSCTALSLTLTAPVSMSVPQQAEEQRGRDEIQGSSAKEKTAKKKIAEDPQAQSFAPPARGFKGLGKEFLRDQEQIWTSPAKIRFSDTQWLVPLSGITAGLFVTDSDFSGHLSKNPATISHYKTLSNAGVGALIGGAGGMWLLGHVRHNEHWSETGFLAGEAALNSLVAVESFKYTLRRERPYQGNGSGSFFQSGGTSFPSEHAAAAWSVAGVIAHEYPGPFTKIMAYGLASMVSFSRVRAHQHFPSDVLVGTVIGNLVAQNIYSRHHDPDLGGGEWRSISQIFRGDGNSTPANQGSPYVPLDSWIYPAFERLAALGVIDSGFAGMRPWTRAECARLVNEANEKLAEGADEESEAAKLVLSLEREFHPEFESASGGANRAFRLESIYTRTEHISGMPLNDGYHFAQTQINDYGRPYREGWNNVTGFSASASSGPFVLYVRGEYQHAPPAPALPDSARQVISLADFGLIPPPPATPIAQTDRFRLLDAYVGMNLMNWQLTFGKQSLWWGPGEGGPMMLSDNAEPVNMFRISRVSPFRLPSILGLLGPMRMEFFIGQLEGHNFVQGPSSVVGSWAQPLSPQPFLHGEKLNFKPTPNFELGISRTTIFAGSGDPLTIHKFLQSLLNASHYTGAYGSTAYPGDRLSGLDFSYRLPKLRNRLTLYGNGFANDQIIFLPYGYPERAVWSAGIYAPRLPKLSKLDLRLEGVFTDFHVANNQQVSGFYYSNFRYLNGYVNNGNLLGSWIGRQGQGAQAWTNYWFNARDRVQLNFRHQKVSQEFIPGGGTLTDVGVRWDYQVRPNLGLSATVQHERWLFPVIQPGAQKNVAASVQILFQPQKLFQHTARPEQGAAAGEGGRP